MPSRFLSPAGFSKGLLTPRQRRILAEPALTSVTVERLPFGTSSFSQCSAAVSDDDVLTVRCTDATFDAKHGPMHVFQPGTWAEALVQDTRGNVLLAFASTAWTQRRQIEREGRAS